MDIYGSIHGQEGRGLQMKRIPQGQYGRGLRIEM